MSALGNTMPARFALPRSAPGRRATPAEPPLTLSARIACALWAGSLVLSPFYLFDSGLPQIADGLMALLTAWLFVIRGMAVAPKAFGIVATAGVLVAYIAAVNGSWTVLVSDQELLLYTLFYVFNFAALLNTAVLSHWLGRRFGELTGIACLLSVVLQAALSFVLGIDGDGRQTMFFNNPNQLGYYVVLFGSLFWTWSCWTGRPRRTVLLMEVILYASGGWLAIASQSRGGIAAFFLLVGIRALTRANIAFIATVVLGAAVLLQTDLPIAESLRSRLEHKSQGTNEELAYRGYDRMSNHPHYMALGAGEGAYWRFLSEHKGEMHSTFGSLLFCYGVIGLILFLRMFWLLYRNAGFQAVLFVVPPSVYGLSHNGLRQSELWMLFAFVICLHAGRKLASSKKAAGTLRVSSARPVGQASSLSLNPAPSVEVTDRREACPTGDSKALRALSAEQFRQDRQQNRRPPKRRPGMPASVARPRSARRRSTSDDQETRP